MSVHPDHAASHFRLGNVAYWEGDLRDALAHYQHAVARDPAYLDAHYNLAMVYVTLADAELRRYIETGDEAPASERRARLMDLLESIERFAYVERVEPPDVPEMRADRLRSRELPDRAR